MVVVGSERGSGPDTQRGEYNGSKYSEDVLKLREEDMAPRKSDEEGTKTERDNVDKENDGLGYSKSDAVDKGIEDTPAACGRYREREGERERRRRERGESVIIKLRVTLHPGCTSTLVDHMYAHTIHAHLPK